MSFSIQRKENKKFPYFNRPKIVGYFSLNGANREYSEDLSQLKYYYKYNKNDNINFNLNDGIQQVIRKPQDLNEKIDFILRWIINNHQKILANPDTKKWLKPDFICFRGLLTKICCTPYDEEGWIICAVKFHGTIYLCAFDTDEQKKKYFNMSDKNLQFMSWGYKFEQFLLTDSPGKVPCTTTPVNEAEEFCCLFNTKLGQNSLLYGAEMDGVCSENPVQEPIDWKKLKLVELKTNRTVKTAWQNKFYLKKLLKWWCQSFLVGIEDVVCGNRNEKGIIQNLTDVKVSEMPKICKNVWDATACMNFCNDFLNFVKSAVNREYNECIYKFEYKVGQDIKMETFSNSSEFSFIPDWFVEQYNQLFKK